MDKIDSLTSIEKEQLIRYLGSLYYQGVHSNREMSHAAKESEIELIEQLRTLLKGMNRKYAMIILNDFFEIKERNWWHSMYSPSTYYRNKRAAVTQLLKQLYCVQ